MTRSALPRPPHFVTWRFAERSQREHRRLRPHPPGGTTRPPGALYDTDLIPQHNDQTTTPHTTLISHLPMVLNPIRSRLPTRPATHLLSTQLPSTLIRTPTRTRRTPPTRPNHHDQHRPTRSTPQPIPRLRTRLRVGTRHPRARTQTSRDHRTRRTPTHTLRHTRPPSTPPVPPHSNRIMQHMRQRRTNTTLRTSNTPLSRPRSTPMAPRPRRNRNQPITHTPNNITHTNPSRTPHRDIKQDAATRPAQDYKAAREAAATVRASQPTHVNTSQLGLCLGSRFEQ